MAASRERFKTRAVGAIAGETNGGAVRGAQIGAVRQYGLGVDDGRVLVAPDSEEGVRGHVHEVAGARGEGAQVIGIGQGQGGIAADLGGVDVEVDGAGVVGVALQDGLQHGDRTGDALVVVVLLGQHQPGVGGEDGDLVVLRIAPGERVHGPGEGHVGGRPRSDVAQFQRLDQRLVLRRLRSSKGGGLVDDRAGRPSRRGIDVVINGRAVRPGLAPGAHGAGRVYIPRPPEGQLGVLVIEGVGQLHAIVEPSLGLGLGGDDRKAASPHARRHDQPPLAPGRRRVVLGRAEIAHRHRGNAVRRDGRRCDPQRQPNHQASQAHGRRPSELSGRPTTRRGRNPSRPNESSSSRGRQAPSGALDRCLLRTGELGDHLDRTRRTCSGAATATRGDLHNLGPCSTVTTSATARRDTSVASASSTPSPVSARTRRRIASSLASAGGARPSTTASSAMRQTPMR